MEAIAAKPPITPEEFYALGDAGKGFELIDGVLKETPMSTESSYFGGKVYRALDEYADASPGWAFPPETGFRCFPFDEGRVRKADAAFVHRERLSLDQFRAGGFCRAVPAVVAEVISPNDLADNVDLKVEEWLSAGVALVWVVSPQTRTVRAYDGDGTGRFLRMKDTLTGNGVLPGFELPLAKLFRLPPLAASGS